MAGLPGHAAILRVDDPVHHHGGRRLTWRRGRTRTRYCQDGTLTSAGRPGVSEKLLTDAGLEVLARGSVDVTSEWPDVATAVRAVTAAGSSWPAIQQVGPAKFEEVMTTALGAALDDHLGIRLTSEFFWITARKPF